MESLYGRTAIITGASRGIGAFIATRLAVEGMSLVLVARSVTDLENIAAHLSSNCKKKIVVPANLSLAGEENRIFETAQRELGVIDVLVNNAAIEFTRPYPSLKTEEIETTIRVNLTSAMLLTRLVLPGMLSTRRGHIVNLASLAGKLGPPYCGPYAATKAALIAFTQSLRSECYGTGVSASVITPGNVETGIYQRFEDQIFLKATKILGPSSPQIVASAVVRAIREDIPEIIINPWPVRPLIALAELSPVFALWFMRRIGINEWFRKIAEHREHAGHENGSGSDRGRTDTPI